VSTLRTIKKLVLGETWVLPLGLLLALLASDWLLRPLLGDAWRHAGGFVLLALVCALLIVSVASSARRR
jgi:hypothetical protein